MKNILSRLALAGLLIMNFSFKAGNRSDLEIERYLNFIAAIQHRSTFSYFTVIKAKNLNTGIVKEICTKGKFVLGALHIELKLDYDEKGMQKVIDFAKSKKDRYFEFRNQEALDNISFFDYNTQLADNIRDQFNFNNIIEIIKKKGAFSIRLPDTKMKAFAHVLFNNGYLSGENDCFGGNLEYVDRIKSNY